MFWVKIWAVRQVSDVRNANRAVDAEDVLEIADLAVAADKQPDDQSAGPANLFDCVAHRVGCLVGRPAVEQVDDHLRTLWPLGELFLGQSQARAVVLIAAIAVHAGQQRARPLGRAWRGPVADPDDWSG